MTPRRKLSTLTTTSLTLLMAACCVGRVTSLAASPNHNGAAASYTLFDRFRVVCPADTACIRRFDSSLIGLEEDDVTSDALPTWVAVYRSHNSAPSVTVRDEFLQAMKSATSAVTPTSTSDSPLLENAGLTMQTPIAVARLSPPAFSSDEDTPAGSTWMMDQLRCTLEKEKSDATCDGGSEHTEALGLAMDSLLQHYLQNQSLFHGALRCRATLVSAMLLEDRGFVPVEELCRDMATHVSDLDSCVAAYAKRAVDTAVAKSPGAQQRALQLVGLLGKIDRTADLTTAQERSKSGKEKSDNNEEEEYDPWAGMRKFI